MLTSPVGITESATATATATTHQIEETQMTSATITPFTFTEAFAQGQTLVREVMFYLPEIQHRADCLDPEIKQQYLDAFLALAYGPDACEMHEDSTGAEMIFRLEGESLTRVLKSLGSVKLHDLVRGIQCMGGRLQLELDHNIDLAAEEYEWSDQERAEFTESIETSVNFWTTTKV